MRPTTSGSWSRAWSAFNGPARSRIRGRLLAENAGTWRTTSTGAGKSAGSAAASRVSASTPPADVPTARTRAARRLVTTSAYGAEGAAHHDLCSVAARLDLDVVHDLPDHGESTAAQARLVHLGPGAEVANGEEQLPVLAPHVELESRPP